MPDLVLDIAVGIAVHRTFHYLAPEELKDKLTTGSRVLVPFGSRRVTGTVIGFPEKAERSGLKSVIEVLDSPVSPGLMKLARWMADYYLHPLGLAVETMVPRAVGRTKPKKKKYLRLKTESSGRREGAGGRGKKQAALIELLTKQGQTTIDLLEGFSRATIKSLVDAGIVEIIEREEERRGDEGFVPDAPPELMSEQTEAVRRICGPLLSGTFEVFLLHGVTGSGKTEVYLHCIASLSGTGRGAIVLVPEIALTPQLVGRFRRRFGGRVAVLHSGLTDRERADEYRRIQAGGVDVAIGARSAVFAPFEKLGLVIVDEEQENSYKQEEGLRYHARDVAVMRAKIQNAVCVLGSATPSLESFYNAKTGKYQYLAIANRVDHRPLPAVEIVDVKSAPKTSSYAPALVAAMQERLEKKEQALLLLNRRGFSSVLICRDCGAAMKCPSCSVSLTYHKSEKRLKCHYCDFYTSPPAACPTCSGNNLHPLGAGTQRIEEEVAALFPEARIARMDSDSVRGRQAYDTLLGKVDRGEIDILLGTQMVAKGHDFPSVTLVGVVDADVGLNLPDFRSAEKTFQLITQAAGRAGRGEAGGEVIVQTTNPGHYSLICSKTHDYEGFYEEEIKYRTELGYPPLRRIVKIELRSPMEKTAEDAAKAARDRIRKLMKGTETTVLGPAPAPIARVRGKYRFQLLLISSKREQLRTLATEGRNAVEEKFGRRCQVIVDRDPVNLM
jgi:primosomal protein N' (replication factor Y)